MICRNILFVIIIILLTSSVFAQGDYLQKGESGFGVGFGSVFNQGGGVLGVHLGYSAGGVIDFGVLINAPLGVENISINMAVHLFKLSDSITPLGISLIGESTLDSEYSDDSYSYGAVLYSNIPITTHLYIQPFLGFANIITSRRYFQGDRIYHAFMRGVSIFADINHDFIASVGVSYSSIGVRDKEAIGVNIGLIYHYEANK